VSKNLDEIDLKILSEIQADGRITNVELAKRVGISPPPCLRRVRTLEEEGYIQGYRGLLDPRRLGFDVTVFAAVHLSSQAEADLRAFEEFVRSEPLVRECWMRISPRRRTCATCGRRWCCTIRNMRRPCRSK
jgi:DNA-binding Lrp family transcriptional regulator